MKAVLQALNIVDPRAEALLSAPAPLVELSVNERADPRGALRLSIFDHDADRIAAALADAPALQRTHRACPPVDGSGAGIVIGTPRTRWWQFGGPRGHAALGSWARAAWPHHRAALDWIAPHGRLTVVGAEGETSVRRTTVYAALEDPDHAFAVLRRAGLRLGTRSAALVGIMRDMRYPTLWIGHSMGDGGGLKLYLFLRDALCRASDATLLDRIGADERQRRMVAAFARPAVIQVLGLTWPSDGAPPRWTLYLADH